MVTGVSFPEGKAGGSEADHSPQTNAQVKKTRVYTSTPPYVFMPQCLIFILNLDFFLQISRKLEDTCIPVSGAHILVLIKVGPVVSLLDIFVSEKRLKVCERNTQWTRS
jgi:hypothetical protein